MTLVPCAFRCVIRERHAAEDPALFWRWITARHTNLKKKFAHPEVSEDDIDKHIISMVKEYRDQKVNGRQQWFAGGYRDQSERETKVVRRGQVQRPK